MPALITEASLAPGSYTGTATIPDGAARVAIALDASAETITTAGNTFTLGAQWSNDGGSTWTPGPSAIGETGPAQVTQSGGPAAPGFTATIPQGATVLQGSLTISQAATAGVGAQFMDADGDPIGD